MRIAPAVRTVFITLTLALTAATAHAGVITGGTWNTLQPCSGPYRCASYDGSQSHLTTVLGDLTGWEYLASAPFRFPAFVNLGTVYTATGFPTTLSQDLNGVFRMDNGHGGLWSSEGAGWNHYLALRKVLTPYLTEYRITVEDLPFQGEVGYGVPGIPVSDDDFTDLMVRALEDTTPGIPEGGGGARIPEPASLVLFGIGALAVARRLRRV